MRTRNSIQQSMFRDLKNKDAFEKAQSYAYEYLDEINDRNVYPTTRALQYLNKFEEER